MFSNHICAAPEQDGPNLKIWRTVLTIPLHSIHTCTSHVHLHFRFVWIIKDKTLQAKASKAIEKVVSACAAQWECQKSSILGLLIEMRQMVRSF